MKNVKNTVSAATRVQIFTAVNTACRTYGVDDKQLLPVYGKKLNNVPAGLKKSWLQAHQIAKNYGKANRKDGEWTVVRKDTHNGDIFVDHVRNLSPEALTFVMSHKPTEYGRSIQYGSMDNVPSQESARKRQA